MGDGDGPVEQPQALALVGGRILRGDALEPSTLVVADGRIAAVHDASARPPDGSRVVDLGGATLLPGFIDAHVHIQFASAGSVLAGGVTTVRDLGSPPPERLAAAATPLGMVFAGRILTARGGYPTRTWGGRGESREVRDAADGRRAVEEQLAEGATVVKVALEPAGGAPLLQGAVLEAIVTAAHDADVGVTAHVGSAAALELALDVGIDELAHLPLHDVTPAEMERVAAAGVTVCPTMGIRRADSRGVQALAAFHRAGGVVVYGTDLGNAGTAPGISVDEVRALLAAALTPAEVLAAATAVAADHLGLPDRGRIATGAVADVLAVDGNPLTDPEAYRRVRLVLASGLVVGGDRRADLR